MYKFYCYYVCNVAYLGLLLLYKYSTNRKYIMPLQKTQDLLFCWYSVLQVAMELRFAKTALVF